MNGNKLQSTYDAHYHDRQFQAPYQSTIAFSDWLVALGAMGEASSRILDLGCGKGANLYYLARRFPHCAFVGLDLDEQLVRDGQEYFSRAAVPNCQLSVGDLHCAGSHFTSGEFDGIISLQTLSWLPGYDRAIDAIVSLSPKWLALTSLFFEGPIEARTVISEFDPGQDGKVKRALHYKHFKHSRFDIPIDLPRPVQGKMQTYTELTTDGRRLQISGPLLMNWHFIYAALES